MSVLCSLKNLTLTYPHKTLFQEVNFTLNQGDRIGVLGLNGHGKSSLFKIMNEDVSADTTVPPFLFDKNKDFSLFLVPQELPIKEGIKVCDYFYEFFPKLKELKSRVHEISERITQNIGDIDKLIHEQTALYEELEKLGEQKLYSSYTSFLKYFGIEDIEMDMALCSGGQQRKMALALGLSAPQEIILWDEPTNHLDLETIELFEDELRSSKKTFMLITHDRTLLNNIVERIIHIKQGRLESFKGTYSDYLNFLQEEQKRREKELDKLSNIQRVENLWMSRGVKARRTKSKKRIEGFHELNEQIKDLKSKAHRSAQINIQSSGRKTKILAEFKNVSLRFGDNELFRELNLQVAKGDKIALMGKNGAGKSSLLKILQEQLKPTTGEVKRALDLSVGYFSQKREGLNPDETPWGLIGEGIDYVISNTGDKKHVAGYLENFLFKSEELKRPISTFSGGEKNRLQLAQFMKHAQDIWIFDEPTNDLDLETIGILEEELKNYKGALIVVGHDRSFIENVTDKCWFLHEKKIEVFEGGLEQAMPYMEAVKLEEKLKEQQVSNERKTSQEVGGLNYSEKQELSELPSKIEKLEKESSELQEAMASFNYEEMDGKKKFELKKVQDSLERVKSKLEQLYQRWEELESKK